MKRLVLFLLLALPAFGQLNSNTLTVRFPGVPSGPCGVFMLGVNNANNALYDCGTDHAWHATGGGGSGTVTSVSWTGGIVSVATPTTTPAFTIAGTSGGIPYFSGASTWASSGALTANLPVIGGGAGLAPSVGTVTGNTTQFATWTGATTASRCVQTDASGNLVIAAAACGTGSGTVTATGGSLTSNAVVLGAGTTDTKVSTGITTNGASELDLGVSGTSGAIGLLGSTSGTAKCTAPAVAGTSTNPIVCTNGFTLGTTPATTGNILNFPNASTFYGRNAANTGDIRLWNWDNTNALTIGGLGANTVAPVNVNIQAGSSGPNLILDGTNNRLTINGTSTTISTGAFSLGNAGTGTMNVGAQTAAATDTTGKVRAAGYMSVGTTFTTNAGCTDTSLVGGATAGKFTIGQSTSCTTIVTMGNSATAPNGWSCWVNDQTALATLAFRESASTTTTASFTGTGTSGDVLNFGCMGY